MRWSAALAGVTLCWFCPLVRADDRPWLQQWAERTPLPRRPVEHTAGRAGYPLSVSCLARPSVTGCDQAGYIGGASICNNNLLARGPGAATGPVATGVFGTDYAGVRRNLGRLFLAPSDDPARGHPAYLSYRAEGPRVPDPLAVRPFRNAVLAKREAEEGHGEHGGQSGHGGGHAPEGGEPKGGGH
jgi:hypothetical protein